MKKERWQAWSPRVFFYSERTRIKFYIPSSLSHSIAENVDSVRGVGIEDEGKGRRERGNGSPIPESRSLKRMVLSTSFPSSFCLSTYLLPVLPPCPCNFTSFSLLCFSSSRFSSRPSNAFVLLDLPSLLFSTCLCLSLSFFFCTSSSVSLSLTLSSQLLASRRLPRIRQDYLSFSKGRSRLNLKHHLNKREVTAPCYELH